ncbi:MAG: MBL fold metallo-hydrolase [Gammaproteobacteria bacterium]|nr:MBL fold metallo-hydrolase [Gammaproteobacteria bacterium]
MTTPLKAADLNVVLPVLAVDRGYDPVYAKAVEIAPLIRRVLARNPNHFTFHGTGTYIVGRGNVAVIDPGPLIDEHLDALKTALAGETVTHILVTHTHNDHSPAAAPLKAATGAKTYGYGAHGAGKRETGVAIEEGGDMDFHPDVTVGHGAVIVGDGWTIDCVYTPGHTSNHMCFALREVRALFVGDHVMGWSTTVIVPPDGDMAQYFASLEILKNRTDHLYYPTHGNPIHTPQAFVSTLIEHRHARERQIAACLTRGLSRIPDMVAVIYSEIDQRLHAAAAMSVLAHLQHMVATGRAVCAGGSSADTHYRLVT